LYSYFTQQTNVIAALCEQIRRTYRMTLVASILFLCALMASVFAILSTVGNAMPRIVEVVEAEFRAAPQAQRYIHFGPVRSYTIKRANNVVPFPQAARVEQEFKLAA
jgi:hypothetical protein